MSTKALRIKLFERDFAQPLDKHPGEGKNPKALGWLPPLPWVDGVDQRRAAAKERATQHANGRPVSVNTATDGEGEYIVAIISKNKPQ
ncbi:MAG: hypothetical protein EKK55_07080 [Rhodocyclaceae bacterium]|nr:MAG: hypothetical protein EKK55_07080 [Rhodocyclaceae bacterium]